MKVITQFTARHDEGFSRGMDRMLLEFRSGTENSTEEG